MPWTALQKRSSRGCQLRQSNPRSCGSAIRSSHYDTADYVDLVDLSGLLKQGAVSKDIKAACSSVIDSLTNNGMVVKSGYKGNTVNNSHGISIYFPVKNLSPLYSKLDFVKKTAWGEFLKEYVGSVVKRKG